MRRLPWGARAIVALALATFAPPIPGARAESARAITRKDALSLAATQGPGVAIAGAPVAGLNDAASASHATLALPPHVTFSYGHRYGALGGGAEIGVTAMLDVPLRAIGSARSDVATSLLAATDLDVARAKSDAMLRSAIAWSRAVEAKEVLRLRGDALKEARAIADLASKRSKAGTGDELELSLAKADVGAAEAAELDAEGLLVDALAELRFATGLPANAAVDPVGDLYAQSDEIIDEKAAIDAAEARDPTLRVAAARAAAAKHEIALAKAVQGPILGIGGSFVRDGFGDKIWTGIVSIPLPFTDPARFEAARASANADVAAAEVAGVRAEVQKDVRVALHDRIHTREVRDKLRDEAIAPLKKALAIARAQYEAGTRDVVLVLTIRQRLHAIEEQYARACGEVLRADFRLARRTGTLGA